MGERMIPLLWDEFRASRAGPEGIAQRQAERLRALVSYARERSPYYRELYRDLPERVEDVSLLPVTTKADLMGNFDACVTDPAITRGAAQRFVDDPGLVGEPFLNRYALATTSGTTGTRALFVLDERSMAVMKATGVRMIRAWLGPAEFARVASGRGRTALLVASGGHFASTLWTTRLQGSSRLRRKAVQVFPVQRPTGELVEQLNRFKPTVIASYASTAALLAREQEAGRLRTRPILVVLAAEGLATGEYPRMARAFQAKVRNTYAASECPFLSFGCAYNWLHVNSDHVVVEGVDADHRPCPPGALSHTVLVTNLANRVQPVIRYDLGDSIVTRPEPCRCGSRLPAIRVVGRTAELLTFATGAGEDVTITPAAIQTALESVPGIRRFQVVQDSKFRIVLRLLVAPDADRENTWTSAERSLGWLLGEQGLGNVAVERGDGPPVQAVNGKFQEVLPLRGR